NGNRRLADYQQEHPGPVSTQIRFRLLIRAAQEVGPALFFSLLIIAVSFLPVFLLQAQEGRMFRPLAWTKTLSIACSSILAITLVPVLMTLLIRGQLRPEKKNPVSRLTQAVYLPVLRFCLRHRSLTILLNLAFLVVTLPLAIHLGSEFMPPLFEGSALYMPTALPGISIEQATALLGEQDRIIRGFPEVLSVFGTVGRSDSATDNAPLSMFDTTVMLKPRSQWPAGMTYNKVIQKMDARLQFPGLSNTWTMPVENRLDMELTGIKTPVGIKVQGPTLEGIQHAAVRIQAVLNGLPQVRSVFAERVAQGFYINVEPNRAEAAKYGLTVQDIQRAVASGIGGENIAENIEGRERYPINVRYERAFRTSPREMRGILIGTPSGAQIPLGEVARVTLSRGPSMIRDEGGALTGYIFIDLKGNNYGGFVDEATKALQTKLQLPAGYTFRWAGEYEFELRAKHRLKLIFPIVFFVIFLLLYMVFHSTAEAFMLIIPTIYALSGGLLLQYLLGYEFSVAVWVGYIALFGIAVETGVVMMVYLRDAFDRNRPPTRAALEAAVIEGAVQRLRPVLMTVICVLASLGPILWETGIGSDVMKPIAAPIVGGMITSAINVLLLVPILFTTIKARSAAR
ncbi:MAG TPA: efflux RND transporter permease subunit, partial [Bryobacteraceae bacterium]